MRKLMFLSIFLISFLLLTSFVYAQSFKDIIPLDILIDFYNIILRIFGIIPTSVDEIIEEYAIEESKMIYRGICLPFPQTYSDIDYQRLKSWNLNSVMFVYYWSYIEPYYDKSGVYDETRLQLLEQEIAKARSHGLYPFITSRVCRNPTDFKSWVYPWEKDGKYIGPTHDYVNLNLSYCHNPYTCQHYVDGLASGRDRYSNYLKYMAQRFPDVGIAVWHFPYHAQDENSDTCSEGYNRRDVFYTETLPSMYQAVRSVDNRVIALSPIDQGAEKIDGVNIITGEYVFLDRDYIDYLPVEDKNVLWECNTHDGAYGAVCRACVNGNPDEWNRNYTELDEQWQPAADFKAKYDVRLVSLESIGLVIHNCSGGSCPQCGVRPIKQSRLDWVEAMLQKQDELDMSWFYWRYEKSPYVESPQEIDGSDTPVAELISEWAITETTTTIPTTSTTITTTTAPVNCDAQCEAKGYDSGICREGTPSQLSIKKGLIAFGFGNLGPHQHILPDDYPYCPGCSYLEHMATNFDILQVGVDVASKHDKLDEIRALNPDIIVFFYKDVMAMHEYYEDWDEVNKHEDWFIHDTDGSRLEHAIHHWYCMDPSNQEWRDHFVSNVKYKLDTYDFDGVFLDDAWSSLFKDSWTVPAEKVPDYPNWQDEMLEFLSYVKSQIGEDKVAMHNSMSNVYLDATDGKMCENCFFWEKSWRKPEDDIDDLYEISGGGEYYAASPHVQLPKDTEEQFMYGFSCYLLGMNGENAYFSWMNIWQDTSHGYWPQMDEAEALGSPVNDHHLLKGRVYKRDFENGIVLANLDVSTSDEICIDGEYETLDGQSVPDCFTMNAKTGKILLKTAPAEEVKLYRLGSSHEFSGVSNDFIANNFDMTFTNFDSFDERVAQVKAIRPDILMLKYRNIRDVNIHSDADDNGIRDIEEFKEKGWLAKSPDGKYLVHEGFRCYKHDWHPDGAYVDYCVDISNPEYQEWVSNFVADEVNTYGYDGAWLDWGLNGNFGNMWWALHEVDQFYGNELGVKAEPANFNDWTDVKNALRAIHQKVRDKIGPDKLIILNGCFSGLKWKNNEEGFVEALTEPTTIVNGIGSEGTWYWYNDNWMTVEQWKDTLDFMKWFNDHDMYFLPMVKVNAYGLPPGVTEEQMLTYAWASSLMAVSNNKNYQYSYSTDQNYDGYPEIVDKLSSVEIGEPLGEYYQLSGKNVFKREFSKIIVLVNPSSSTYTINLGEEYETLDGEIVSSITMGGHTGEILLKTSTVGGGCLSGETSIGQDGCGSGQTCCCKGEIVPHDLIGDWKLDEGSGSTTEDSSGYNNDATIHTASWTTDCKSNHCLEFDNNDYIEIPNTDSLSFDKSQGTISMWIKPFNKASGVYQLLAIDTNWGNKPNGGIEFAIQPDGDLYFYPSEGGGTNYNLVTNPLENNKWQFLTVTWDYSTKEVDIYINGIEQTFAIENVPLKWDTIADTGDWHIGGTSLFTERTFDGIIDEVKVWNYALSEEEIMNEYNKFCNAACIEQGYNSGVCRLESGNLPIKKLSVAYVGSFTDEDAEFIASNFDIVDTGFGTASTVGKIKALNPNVIVLGYRDIMMMQSYYDDWTEADAHEDWFLHDINGNRLKNKIWGAYAMNISNPGWRDHYANYVKNKLEQYPLDGVFADDTWNSFRYDDWTVPSNEISAEIGERWQNDMIGMIQHVKSVLGSKLLILNSNDWTGEYLKHADGMMFEHFVHKSTWDLDYYGYPSFDPLIHVDRLANLSSTGKYFLTYSGSKMPDNPTQTDLDKAHNVMMYCFASYLLGVKGEEASFGWMGLSPAHNKDGSRGYYPEFDEAKKLGPPINDYYLLQDYVYARDFMNGKVLVNPTSNNNVIVALDGLYETLEGDMVFTISLNNHTGEILLKTSGTGNIIFRSGFEEGITVSHRPDGGASYLHGADLYGYEWDDLDSAFFNYVGAGAYPAYVDTRLTTDYSHSGSRSLYQEVTERTGNIRNQLKILCNDGDAPDSQLNYMQTSYTSKWIRLSEDFELDSWLQLAEFRESDIEGTRIGCVAMDIMANGALGLRWHAISSYHEVAQWEEFNEDVPVPLGEWFRLETLLYRHTTEGFFKAWVTPDGGTRQLLFDSTVQQPGGTMTKYEQDNWWFKLAVIYSFPTGTGDRQEPNYPFYQWIDDVEIWDGIPSEGGCQSGEEGIGQDGCPSGEICCCFNLVTTTSTTTTIPSDTEPPQYYGLGHYPDPVIETDPSYINVTWSDNEDLDKVIIYENSTGSWEEHVCNLATGECSGEILSNSFILFFGITSSIVSIAIINVKKIGKLKNKFKIALHFIAVVLVIFLISMLLFPEIPRNILRMLRLAIVPMVFPPKTFTHEIPAENLDGGEFVVYYSYAKDTSGNEKTTEIKTFIVQEEVTTTTVPGTTTTTTVLTTTSTTTPLPTTDLVGYWKFDEGTGNTTQDSSDYGNDGNIYVTGRNQIQNPSFEKDKQNWGSGSGDWQIVTNEKYHGSKSSKFTDSIGDVEYERTGYVYVSVTPGEPITISVYSKGENVQIGSENWHRALLIGRWINSTGDVIPDLHPDMYLGGNATDRGLGTWDWKRSNTTYIPSADAVKYRFIIGLIGSSTGTLWVDAVQVEYGDALTDFKYSPWTSGKYGSALSFDGVDDYVETTNNPSLVWNGSISVVLWVKPESNQTSEYQIPVTKHSWSANRGFWLQEGYQGDHKPKFVVANGTGWTTVIVPVEDALKGGDWYHIAGVTKADEYIKVYVNGEEKASKPFVGEFVAYDASGTPLRISHWLWPFNGIIDEVKIYKTALSEDEIKNEYLYGEPSTTTTSTVSSTTTPSTTTPSEPDELGPTTSTTTTSTTSTTTIVTTTVLTTYITTTYITKETTTTIPGEIKYPAYFPIHWLIIIIIIAAVGIFVWFKFFRVSKEREFEILKRKWGGNRRRLFFLTSLSYSQLVQQLCQDNS